MSCDCYNTIGFITFWGVITLVAFKLLRGLYTSYLADALGHTFQLKGEGKHWAVVTGATDGIGLEYAKILSKKGYKTLLISRSLDKLQSVKTSLESSTTCPEVKVLAKDFTSDIIYPDIAAAIADLPGDIHVLVNNVGMSYCTPEYFTQLHVTNKPGFAQELININILSMTKMMEIVLPRMEKQKKGLVINLSSLSAAYPTPLLSVYGACKMYVDILSRALNTEYKDKGIVVQSVLPSYVATKMSKIRKSSLLVPTPANYVAGAIKTIGVEGRTYGYWSHKLQGFVHDSIIVGWLGEQTMVNLAFSSLKKINKAYYRKYVNNKKE